MQTLQIEHNKQLNRISQLQADHETKAKNKKYQQLNSKIFQTRNELEEWMNTNLNASVDEIDNHILQYMDYVQYLLAGQTPPN